MNVRSEARMRFSMRVVLSFLMLLSLIHGCFWHYIGYPSMLYYSLSQVVVMAALFGLERMGISVIRIAQLLLVVMMPYILVPTAVTWSQSQTTIGYFYALYVGVVIFLGFRAAVATFILSGLCIAGMPWIASHFHMPAQFEEVKTAFNLLNTLAIGLVILMMVYLSESYSKSLVAALLESKRNLESTKENLLKVQSYRNRFFSSISHEIRTPLNAVRGIAELLSKHHSLPQEDEILISALNRSSVHLLSIINDLLDVSKLEENKLRFVDTDFDLREALYDAFTIVKIAASEKDIDFNLSIDDALPQYVRGDPNRLRQVLVNLLGNAVKFTNEGHVKLACQWEEDGMEGVGTLLMHITDTGIGIPKDMQADIFEGYMQGGDDIAQQYGGTGLGLNISKRIIENQGGKIWFQSELGKGSTFFVSLPLLIAKPLHHAPQIQTEKIWPTNLICNILLVDDNKINLLVAERQLQTRMPNATFSKAENGQEALNLITQGDKTYHIILMDLHMPVMGGLEATKQIRAMARKVHAEVPVIAMTANTSEEEVENCYAAGMNDFIAKPFDVDELLIKVLRLIDIPSR